MTASIHSFPPAKPAGSAGVNGSPRPRAEFYTPWGMIPEQWIDPATERDARHAEIARQMQIARQTDAPLVNLRDGIDQPDNRPIHRLFWLCAIAALGVIVAQIGGLDLMPGLFNFASDADAEKARADARRYAEYQRDKAMEERRAYAVALEVAALKRRIRERIVE